MKTLINGRWPLILPKHRADRPQWPWWEATRLAAMRHFIRENDVVFDIGAEEGDFPALFASWGAQVVMFEPNPKVWPNIKYIFDENGLKPRACVAAFAGEDDYWPSDSELFSGADQLDIRNGSVEFKKSDGWPDCADGELIGDHGFMNLSERPDIPRVRIDSVGIVPQVITIDTEGSELRVLRGAEETLTKHRPIVFVSVHGEFMFEQYEDQEEDLHKFMKDRGYHGTFLTKDHEEHWLFHPERSFH